MPNDAVILAGARTRIGRDHPFGDPGTRSVLTLITKLHKPQARYGPVGICGGSGQDVAAIVERIRRLAEEVDNECEQLRRP